MESLPHVLVTVRAFGSDPAALEAEGEGWEELPEVLLYRVLLLLPLDARSNAACACRAWRCCASSAGLWLGLEPGGCWSERRAEALSDGAFLALAATAQARGGGLLTLDVSGCRGLSADVVARVALESSATLLSLRALRDAPLLPAHHLLQISHACRQLREARVGGLCGSCDAACVLLALPRLSISRLELRGLSFVPALEASALAAAAQRHGQHLRALSLAGCRLGDAACASLVGSLRGHPCLEALNLDGCGLGPIGATACAAAIQHDALGLRTLRLSDNPLFAEGARALATALRRNTRLISLSLASCGLGSAGGRHLARAVRHSRTLRTLDLNHNSLGDAGALALAEALADGCAEAQCGGSGADGAALRSSAPSGALIELHLRHNALGDAAAAAFAALLRLEAPLMELDLRFNGVGGRGAQQLADALSGNTRCARLLLSGNTLTRQLARQLQRDAGGRLLAADQWAQESEVEAHGGELWCKESGDNLSGEMTLRLPPRPSTPGQPPAFLPLLVVNWVSHASWHVQRLGLGARVALLGVIVLVAVLFVVAYHHWIGIQAHTEDR